MAQTPVAALAQRLALAASASTAARIDALQNLLGSTPLASGAWLDLAIARAKVGAPMEDVSSALAMSAMTGPNEARLMAGRAAFGLPYWERLPPDVRRTLINDLVGGWSAIGPGERLALADQIALVPDPSRGEMLAALLLVGKPADPIIKALDLSPEAGADGGDETAAPVKPGPAETR
ncbi:hypothetical protein GGD83_004126 [Rhodoblastus sphagnicola]|nr:hypothetical protein [Rhodoblastus sphagnicola]MBB4200297.1 hypothetical protein [Rhodoblastus sphagnicola]